MQIILRWHIQKGNVVFPKSSNPKHIKENSEIFDFNLTNEEMEEINKMGNTKKDFSLCLWKSKKNFLKVGNHLIKSNFTSINYNILNLIIGTI